MDRIAPAAALRTTGRARRRRLVAFALLLPLALAACGGSDDASVSDVGGMWAPAPMPGVEAGMDVATMDRSAAMDAGMDAVKIDAGIPGDGRAVVRNAYLELVVEDGARAVAAVTAQAAAVGGYVASTNLSRAEDGTVSGSLTLRVPAERLDETVDALDALARAVPVRNVDEYDVTLQLSDLDARLENLRAYETELRALLTEVRERGGGVEDLLAVSDRLRDVRIEIDMVEAWRTQIATDVALSSVTVFVQQARATTPVVGTWDLPGIVRDALAASVRVGQLVVEAIVYGVIAGLPALLLLIIVWRVVSAIRRRRQRRRAAAIAAASTTAGTTASTPPSDATS
jgi:hypothetical protein